MSVVKNDNKFFLKIDTNYILILSLSYLYLPLLIFLLSWIKIWMAVVCVFASGLSVYGLYKDFRKSNSIIELRLSVAILFLFVLVSEGILLGWGGWFPQAYDWIKHNGVLNDLVNYSWPVYYKSAANPSMLTYNIGNYLAPALLGKLFHSFKVAQFGLFLWLELGLVLVILNLMRVCKANTVVRQLTMIVVFVFFNGCLLLDQHFYDVISGYYNYDIRWMLSSSGAPLYQYKSNMTCMRWIMPQTICIWLIMTMWWDNKEKYRHYVALMLPAMLSGILPFVGLCFMALVCILFEIIIRHDYRTDLRSVFSFNNIFEAATTGLILLLYYSGNVFNGKPDDISFDLVKPDIITLMCFLIADIGIYCILLWKEQKMNGIFWGALLLLLILPFTHMGKNNDLLMCANVPGMFALMIIVIKYFMSPKNNIVTGILISTLVLASLYPIKEFKDSSFQFQRNILPISLKDWSDLSLSDEDFKYNYFTYNIDDNIFVQYIARQK